MKRSWRAGDFGGVGEERDPAGAIEHVVDAGGQLGVEGLVISQTMSPIVWVSRVRRLAAARS